MTEIINAGVKLELIKQEVASFYKVSVLDLEGRSRKKPLVTHRHKAMHLARQILDIRFATLRFIGEKFDNRDHSTVLHAIETTENDLYTTPKLKTEYEFLLNLIKERIKNSEAGRLPYSNEKRDTVFQLAEV